MTVAELHTALEACRREGGRLGTHLLRFGYVTEPKLLRALSRQFGVKPVTTELLVSQSPEVDSGIPLDVQRRLRAVPFERHGQTLAVAMVNPRDMTAREELERLSGLHVETYVATERALNLALEASGTWRQLPDGHVEAPRISQESNDHEDRWEAFWEPPTIGPGSLGRALAGAAVPSRRISLAAFPSLVEVDGDDLPPMNVEEFRSQLRLCRKRDQVGELLMAFARQYLARVVLLAVQKERLSGWMGGGYEISVEDVEALEISLEGCTKLRGVIASGRPFTGAVGEDPCWRALESLFGTPSLREVVVAPLRIGNKTAALMIGDQPDGGLHGVPVDVLADAAVRAGLALEIVILTKKI